jgi:hypothetical protein
MDESNATCGKRLGEPTAAAVAVRRWLCRQRRCASPAHGPTPTRWRCTPRPPTNNAPQTHHHQHHTTPPPTESIGLENTEDNRRAYRELLVTTPGLGQYISGAILFEETLFQVRGWRARVRPLVAVLCCVGQRARAWFCRRTCNMHRALLISTHVRRLPPGPLVLCARQPPQSTSSGKKMVDCLTEQKIVPGIKVRVGRGRGCMGVGVWAWAWGWR